MYLCARESSQESEMSCICVLGNQARKVRYHVFVC